MMDKCFDKRITRTILIALMLIDHAKIAKAFLEVQTTSNLPRMFCKVIDRHPVWADEIFSAMRL
jgi:hypothetical protein